MLTLCVSRVWRPTVSERDDICFNEKCPREAADLCVQALLLGSIYGRNRRHIYWEKAEYKREQRWHRSRKEMPRWESTASERRVFLWRHGQPSIAYPAGRVICPSASSACGIYSSKHTYQPGTDSGPIPNIPDTPTRAGSYRETHSSEYRKCRLPTLSM